jgi:hypothetical protein
MRSRVGGCLAAMAVLLALFSSPAVATTKGDACAERPSQVLGLGLACRTPHGWEVILADGSRVFTHGPDRIGMTAPESANSHTTPEPVGISPPRAPQCVFAETDYHGLLVYTRPADTADRSAAMIDQIRRWFSQANGILAHTAALSGFTASYRMRCGAAGVPTVAVVTLPTSQAVDSYGSIVSDLRAKGYSSTKAKYWIVHDGMISCNCSGIGSFESDSRNVIGNANNLGPSYGMTFLGVGADRPLTMMHENGHNLGAVQFNAPHTSGAGHCNDGGDVMCYSDGGPSSLYVPAYCPGDHPFDCNGDDYFNPAPQASNYLATHWNIASTMNRFIQVAPLTAVPGPTLLTADAGAKLSWDAPLLAGSSPVTAYRLYRQTLTLDAGYPLVAELPAITRTFQATPGYWWITAVNASGEGTASNSAPVVL